MSLPSAERKPARRAAAPSFGSKLTPFTLGARRTLAGALTIAIDSRVLSCEAAMRPVCSK